MTQTLCELAREHGIDWPLRTERLLLAPLEESDFAELWEYWRLPETSRWTTTVPASQEGLAASWLPGGNQLSIRTLDGVLVGDCVLKLQDPWSQAETQEEASGTQGELGWTLHPEHQGQGYATEAVRALVDLAFGPLGLRRLTAQCFAANEPSWRLMERLGMRRERHSVRDSLHREFGWVDTLTYALLAEEYVARD